MSLQWIEIVWTKRSRGGPDAARRNAVPHGFRLPDLGTALPSSGRYRRLVTAGPLSWQPPSLEGPVFLAEGRPPPEVFLPAHLVFCSEDRGFLADESLAMIASRDLLLTRDQDESHRPIVRVHPGILVELGQRLGAGTSVRFERRFRTGGDGRNGRARFWLRVVNVAYGRYDPTVFLREPTHRRIVER